MFTPSIRRALMAFALLGASAISAPAVADAGETAQASAQYFSSTRKVYYHASQSQTSGWFTAEDVWKDGYGYLKTTSSLSGASPITSSVIRPTVSGHGVALSTSIQYGAGLGVGFGAGGGTCDLGDYGATGSAVYVFNNGKICVISSHIAVYGGDAHVTAKTLFAQVTWVTFSA